jgi:hypothetical protein
LKQTCAARCTIDERPAHLVSNGLSSPKFGDALLKNLATHKLSPACLRSARRWSGKQQKVPYFRGVEVGTGFATPARMGRPVWAIPIEEGLSDERAQPDLDIGMASRG